MNVSAVILAASLHELQGMMLEISTIAYQVMLAHCQWLYPEEACGFLGGQDGRATIVTPVENRLHSPVTFEMEPLQQLEAMLHLEEAGDMILAAYHSHPQGPPRPSYTDMVQAYYPDMPQLIISLQRRSEPDVRAFLVSPDEIRALEWRLV